MFEKIEQLVMELRKMEHIHICQSLTLETEIIKDCVSRTEGEVKTIIQHIHIVMYEFVDRRKFEDYKLVLDAEYSSDDKDEVLAILFNRMTELKTLYEGNAE